MEHVLTKYLLPCLLFCNLGFCNLAWAEPSKSPVYDVTFSATFRPDREVVEASITVTQSTHALRLLDFTAPEPEFLNFSGDGTVLRDGKHLVWTVPDTGGTLHYDVQVEHERGLLLDARMTDDWAILRLDDLFPPARVRSRIGAVSNSQLELQGPPGWLFESRYGPVAGPVSVTAPDRRFDRPTGWLAAGNLGGTARKNCWPQGGHRSATTTGHEAPGHHRLFKLDNAQTGQGVSGFSRPPADRWRAG